MHKRYKKEPAAASTSTGSSLSPSLFLDGLLVGVLAGVVAVSFRLLLSQLTSVRTALLGQRTTLDFVLWFSLLTAMAFAVYLLLRWAPLSGGSGIPQVEGELHGHLSLNHPRVLVSKFFGGALTSFGGLSVGREGPSIQLGSSCGKLLADVRHRDAVQTQILLSAGAAAGLAAAFNAPLSGVLFTVEELHKHTKPLFLLPALLAAATADVVSKSIFGLEPVFSFSLPQLLPLSAYPWVLLLAVFVGLIGVLFNKTLLHTQLLYRRLPISTAWYPLIAFWGAGLTALFLPAILGGGHSLIEELLHPLPWTALVLLLAAKLIFTAFCYSSGVQGGIFLPILSLGALGGMLVYRFGLGVHQLDAGLEINFILLGMAAILSSVVRAPLLSVILVFEMSGCATHLLTLTIVSTLSCLVAELLRNPPIYDSLLARILQGQRAPSPESAALRRTPR
ncbi:MAG: ClC family H(+)/Cl(-) exchange transporter [Ndongobacter sp.]|nr:ClC family H(+)/Cl(-) exchange transporter [Ndongobacter sp.]